MTPEPIDAEAGAPPVHRLTMLANDRASAWLPLSSRMLAAMAGALLWIFWTGLIVAPAWVVDASIPRRAAASRRLGVHHDYRQDPVFAATLGAVIAGLLFPRTRRAAIGLQNRAMLALVKRRVRRSALRIDDLRRLDGALDGQIVSLVGWVRGRAHLKYRIDGERCVGVALGCRGDVTKRWPGRLGGLAPYNQPCTEIVEVLHDFDLVDERGVSVPVLVEGARLIGERSVVAMGDAAAERAFIDSLSLPSEVVPLPRQARAVRDGDPVLVIGSKTTVAGVSAVASRPPRPLLIYPIPAGRNAALATTASAYRSHM